ncbi:MAG TPA: hypothetical protein PK777_05795 [Thermoguttaceae bacterium]|nr:hypothetical protein [Thermoguttaceae bacterium]
MAKTIRGIAGLLLGWGLLLTVESPSAYGQRRPLPPPVIVVKPVPKVEIYRATPYWMAVPSYDFRYIVRYPPHPRSYRGVYVSWPWPVYVPYGVVGGYSSYGSGGVYSGVEGSPLPGGWESGKSPLYQDIAPSEPTLPSPSSSGRLEPTPAPAIAPPEPPPAEERLPELVPPPMPQPVQPSPGQK